MKLVIFFAAYLSVNVLAIAYDTFSSDAMSTVGQIYTQYVASLVSSTAGPLPGAWCLRAVPVFSRRLVCLVKVPHGDGCHSNRVQHFRSRVAVANCGFDHWRLQEEEGLRQLVGVVVARCSAVFSTQMSPPPLMTQSCTTCRPS